MSITKEQLDEWREIAERATKTIGWYAHGPGDQCQLDEATVRGPYHRWLVVQEGDEGYPKAEMLDDAKFACLAMTQFTQLLDEIESLQKIEKLANTLTDHVCEFDSFEGSSEIFGALDDALWERKSENERLCKG